MVKSINALGEASSVEYTKDGQVSVLTGALGSSKNYEYDKFQRLISESTASGARITYKYNADGLLEEKKNGRDQSETYTYDKAGNITKVVNEEGTTTYKYDENYNITEVKDSTGTVKRTYDEKSRLVSAKDTKKDGTVISSYTYEYDVMNSITSEVSEVDNIRYEYLYDKLYRLTERKTVLIATGEIADKENFTYDAACNIINSSDVNGTSERSYNANNQLVTMDNNGYAYDKDGNMISGVIGSANATLSYDSQNRLVKMSKDGRTDSYTYDAEGIRTSKVTTETDGKKKTSKYTYNLVSDLTELIYEETKDSIIKYVYGAGSLVSQEVVKKESSNKDNNDKKEISYFHYDLRGSTIALTNESGKITDRYLYSTYGKVNVVEGTKAKTEFLYNGRDGVMNEEHCK
ncbi:MAG: hypothetical protein K6G26_12205 [Lachnospiraceae bacterium]|nr:hypothetical protein [Lachnospiraceae bacterium]